MDLALNNLQRLICHKTQQRKHDSYKTAELLSTYFVYECAVACVDECDFAQNHLYSTVMKWLPL